MASRHVACDLSQTSPPKRQRTKLVPVVGRDYQAADLKNETLKGTLFSGKEICVLSGNEKISKQDLEIKIHEEGGSVVQHRGA